MKLAYRLNLYRSAALDVPVELVQAAEDLGYHSVWSAEAYGTDALSPLAYLAACTRRIVLGTAIAQLAARPPATLAMHAMTIDALAGGGRVIVGIGVLIHDLNNRMGVIVSYTSLLEPQLSDAGASADLAEIKVAANEAVGLARELAAVVAGEEPV